MNDSSRFVGMKNQIVIVLISLPFVGGYRIILACLVVFEVVDLEKETQRIIKARPERFHGKLYHDGQAMAICTKGAFNNYVD